MVSNWARQDFPALAPAVRVPVQFSIAEHEKVWQTDASAMTEIAALFSGSPRFTVHRQPEAGHNISLGHTAADYHATVLSFADECVAARTPARKPIWRPVDARRIHRVGQPGRPDGAADHRSRLPDDAVGAPTRRPSSRSPTPPAKVAESPAELAAASDLVCLCVVGDADVDEITGGEHGVLAGIKPGGVIAVHSTVHPNTCRELAKKAGAQGVSVIDAPVSGGGPAAAEGRLLVMVGGDADVVERCRPVFETYADPIVHLGELGSGQTTKLLNNLLFTANLGTAATALSLAECPRRRARPPHRSRLPQQRKQLRAQRSWRYRRVGAACRRSGSTAAEGCPAGSSTSPTRPRPAPVPCSTRPTPRWR